MRQRYGKVRNRAGEHWPLSNHSIWRRRYICTDRPDKRNAMMRRFWKDMRDAFDLFENDERTCVVIGTGAGDVRSVPAAMDGKGR